MYGILIPYIINSMLCLMQPFISGPVDKSFVKNKMAQLYAMTCVVDYPSRVSM